MPQPANPATAFLTASALCLLNEARLHLLAHQFQRHTVPDSWLGSPVHIVESYDSVISSKNASTVQKTRKSNITNATHDPTDLYLLTDSQSRHCNVRTVNAPRIRRNVHPKKITIRMLGLGRNTKSVIVLKLPQLGQRRPSTAVSAT